MTTKPDACCQKTETDWSSLPDLVPAADAARLLGVLPGTLGKFVQRGQPARPAARQGRAALYRKEDVAAFARARRAEQTHAQRIEARVNESEARVRELEARVEALEGLLKPHLT